MNPHEEDLARGLHAQADRVHGAPLGLDDVRDRARGIQRRRRAVAGLAAAAVVAVVVPVGLGLGGQPRADRPVAPATTSPSPSGSASPTRAATQTPDPTPTRRQGAVPLTVQGAPTGAPAAIDYQVGTTYVSAGGGETELDQAYLTPTPYRGGWLGIDRDDNGQTYLARIDADGKQTGRVPGGDRIVLNADGLRAAWSQKTDDPSGRQGLFLGTTNGHSEGEDSFEAFKPGTASPIAFLGDNLVYMVDGADQDFTTRFFLGPDSPTEIKNVLNIRDVDSANARLAVQTSYEQGESCWAVQGNRGGPVSTSCRWTFDSFNADGTRLIGFPSDTDGLGSLSVALLDVETGKPAVTFEGQPGTFVTSAVWEDDTHALASVRDDDRWQLVRLGVDGSLEVVDVAPRGAGSAEESPYHFAATS